jgi:spore coat protein U-like protein
MKMGAAALSYNFYTTGAFTQIWGDGTAGTAQQTFSTNIQLGNVNFTVYGRVPTGQFAATGTYADSITVTVTY